MDRTPPLLEVLRTTKEHIGALESLGIRTVTDLLLYFPRAHDDLSVLSTIATAPIDLKVTMRGVIEDIAIVRTRSRKTLVKAVFTDGDGDTCDVVWFNQPHIQRILKDGQSVVLTGKLVENGYKLQLLSPVFEKSGETPPLHSGRLVPVYPEHSVLKTKWLREKMALVRDFIPLIAESLPQELVEAEKLLSRSEAIRALHFPASQGDVQRARERFLFEDMYRMQERALLRKMEWQGARSEKIRIPMDVDLIRALFASLKFTPTKSQRIAIYEILRDMEKDVPMSRLLEGDVGSGKTLVAVAIMANVLWSGGQCALMVPTEVLARQHSENISRLLLSLHTYMSRGAGRDFHMPHSALLTGSTAKAEGERIRMGVAAGTVDILIGTHALLEEHVRFRDLKLVIVDEQHRFGVEQRRRLTEKGSPHFLSMTATPIPRTLALTAYGDHDLSVLLEKPGKRPVIATKVVAPKDRTTVERFIDHEITEGRQAFVICPLIVVSSELQDVRNVEQEVLRLRAAFPRRTVAALHGRMSSEEKQKIMRDFRDRASDILVSTSVIEVGIDVPNATVIVIEGAERFGLAQLHQLRGRVGRSDVKSHCFLFATSDAQARSPRLQAMEQYDSGFMLAEIDLKLRGPGELYGLRQSGIPESVLQGLLQPELVHRARKAAEKTLRIAEAVTV